MKRRILVVDDTPCVRELLRLILEASGFEVSEAQDGGAAIREMRTCVFDLVVTDLMMPVVTGQELVRHLRADARTAAVPILVLSANPNAAEIASNIDAIVGKPFNRASFVATVRSLVGQTPTDAQAP